MNNTISWLKHYADVIEDQKPYLNQLDTEIGDGDHGTNMSRGMQAVLEALETKNPQTLQETLRLVGMTLLSKVGGASGPLYGSAFIAMSKIESDSINVDMLQAAFDSMSKRGKSTVGEKTMLDLWSPAIEALRNGSLTKENLETYAQSTDAMKATKGRASFLGERSIGHRDPGAVSSQLLFETLLESGALS